MTDRFERSSLSRRLRILGAILLAAVVFGWVAVQTGLVKYEDGDSFGATLSLGDSNSEADVVGVELTYSIEDKDQTFKYAAIVPSSRRVSFVWKAPVGAGIVNAVVTQAGEPVADLDLTKAGCRVLMLPEGVPIQVELHVHSPAQGSVDLAWDVEQHCG